MPRSHDVDPSGRFRDNSVIARVLFGGPGYWICEFDLSPDDARWKETNRAGGYVVAFPRVPVRIGPPGTATMVVNTTSAVLYKPGQEYSRECLSGRGDFCDLLDVDGSVAEDLGLRYQGSGPRALWVPDAIYAELRILASEVRRAEQPDEGSVRERVFRILRAVIASQEPPRPPRLGARARAARREIVDGLKVALGQRVGLPWSLDEMALEFGVTPAHLCRIFRESTGTTIHAYRERLTLRASLDPLSQDHSDITELALDLGFSSHSHFTGRFGKYFGRPPSELRARLTMSGQA